MKNKKKFFVPAICWKKRRGFTGVVMVGIQSDNAFILKVSVEQLDGQNEMLKGK